MSSSANTVLLITHTQDHFTVEGVAEALTRRGATPFRLDTDRFPADVQLSASFEGIHTQHTIHVGNDTICTGDIIAVWTRKFWTPKLADDLDPQFHEYCVRESREALMGFMDGLHHAIWVNDLGKATQAENKLYQLRVAASVGLRAPRTLVTNQPGHARDFYRDVDGAMVTKLLTALSVGMTQAPATVYTSNVQEEDLADLAQLRHSPMMFQERIPKATELRVAYVAGHVFVGAIDASRSAGGQTDWRRATPEECQWQQADLPEDVIQCLVELMNRLGLVYGAIDLIRTPKGEHVFLEVNPAGEWGMLERDLDYPISEAIADALLNRKGTP